MALAASHLPARAVDYRGAGSWCAPAPPRRAGPRTRRGLGDGARGQHVGRVRALRARRRGLGLHGLEARARRVAHLQVVRLRAGVVAGAAERRVALDLRADGRRRLELVALEDLEL